MSVLDPIFDAGEGKLAEARKAVSAAFAAGVGAFGVALQAGQGIPASLVAGALVAIGGFGFTFGTKANRARR